MSAGRFDAPVVALAQLLRRWRAEQAVRTLERPERPWPRGRRLVLGADAALDLGSPAGGSRAFLLWAPGGSGERWAQEDELLLVGPDVPELVAAGKRETSLGLVILARGAFDDEYDGYLDLKEALYGLELEGLTQRSMPSQGHLWLRLHHESAGDGFSLKHLGGALLEDLGEVAAVRQVTILFVVGDEERLAALAPVADDAKRRVAALIKRHEEQDAECDECEYQDICDEKEHAS